MYDILAKNIRFFREQNGLTQRELAKQIGVSWEMISRYENGKSIPDIKKLWKLANAFNIPVGALFEQQVKKIYVAEKGKNSTRITTGIPLLLSSKGIKSKNELLQSLKKTESFYKISTLRYSQQEGEYRYFAILKDENLSIPGINQLIFKGANIILIAQLVKENEILQRKTENLFLVAQEQGLSIKQNNTHVNSKDICAYIVQIIIDWE